MSLSLFQAKWMMFSFPDLSVVFQLSPKTILFDLLLLNRSSMFLVRPTLECRNLFPDWKLTLILVTVSLDYLMQRSDSFSESQTPKHCLQTDSPKRDDHSLSSSGRHCVRTKFDPTKFWRLSPSHPLIWLITMTHYILDLLVSAYIQLIFWYCFYIFLIQTCIRLLHHYTIRNFLVQGNRHNLRHSYPFIIPSPKTTNRTS